MESRTIPLGSPRKEKKNIRNQNIEQRIMKFLCISCSIFVAIIIFAIISFVGKQGIKVFNDITISGFFTSDYWSPADEEFGAYAFIRGTLILTALSTLLGGFIGIFTAIFMAKIAPKYIRNILRSAVDLFVGIPSVVYGYIGLTVIVPLIRKLFPNTAGFGFLPAVIILAIMILPTIINISEDSIRSVDSSIIEGSYALGATRWQTIYKVVLPSALPGILAGVILGMARALGETMAVLMVIGNAPQLTNSLISPTCALTTGIVMDMGNVQFGTIWSNALFMMATLLLIISLILIILIRLLTRRKVF